MGDECEDGDLPGEALPPEDVKVIEDGGEEFFGNIIRLTFESKYECI